MFSNLILSGTFPGKKEQNFFLPSTVFSFDSVMKNPNTKEEKVLLTRVKNSEEEEEDRSKSIYCSLTDWLFIGHAQHFRKIEMKFAFCSSFSFCQLK